MLSVLKRAIKTCKQRYFLKFLVLAAVLTVLGFVLLVGGVGAALWCTHLLKWAWLDKVADVVIGAGATWLAWLLFPVMMPLVASLFADTVAAHIERTEYGVENAPDLPLLPQIWGAVKFMCVSIGWNILALILLIFPPLWLVGYYAINGWLLGRDFFETVAVRHVLSDEAEALRTRVKWRVWAVGVVLAIMTSIPVVNMLVPLLAIAMMVHVLADVRGVVHPENV